MTFHRSPSDRREVRRREPLLQLHAAVSRLARLAHLRHRPEPFAPLTVLRRERLAANPEHLTERGARDLRADGARGLERRDRELEA
jgi:hypothetical protein